MTIASHVREGTQYNKQIISFSWKWLHPNFIFIIIMAQSSTSACQSRIHRSDDKVCIVHAVEALLSTPKFNVDDKGTS